MKKIFFILSVLFIGLLVGCASNNVPVENVSEKKQPPKEYTVEELVHLPVISKDLFREYFGRLRGGSVSASDSERTDFTIRIINKTNENLTLGFMSNERPGSRWFLLQIPPYETKEFSIPDVVKLGESYICLTHPTKSFLFETTLRYTSTVREIIKTHSLEFTYEDKEPDLSSPYPYDRVFDWSFIEPFECDNSLEEIEWDDLAKLLGPMK